MTDTYRNPPTDPEVRKRSNAIDEEYGGATQEFQGPDGDVILITDTGAAIWIRANGEQLSAPVDWSDDEHDRIR